MQTQNEQLIANRYLLKELIRAHGAVELHAAQDTQLDRPVMVQRLADSGPGDPQMARAFLRHQQIAASIHNCPLLGVYDAGIWDGKPFSVMESDKGRSAGALYRRGYPPDVPAALRVTRQAAEALQCCRDAGLTDWVFAPEAVSVDAEGNGCLAVIEGLGGAYSSSGVEQDAEALDGLLRLMLVGNPDPRAMGNDVSLIPNTVIGLLERMVPGKPNSMNTAGEVAQAIAAVEQAAYQPTQAYEAAMPLAVGSDNNAAIALANVSASPPSTEAPTLAAHAEPAAFASVTTPLEGYVPPKDDAEPDNGRARWLPLVALIGVLLLVTIALAVALPRLRTQGASGVTVPSGQATRMAVAPDLHGKTLDDARNAAGTAGLYLALADPLRDPTFPADMVARQEPEPGVQLQAGSLITVSLSLGREVQPTTAPPQKAAPAPQEAPAPASKPHDRGKKDEDHKKGKDGHD